MKGDWTQAKHRNVTECILEKKKKKRQSSSQKILQKGKNERKAEQNHHALSIHIDRLF